MAEKGTDKLLYFDARARGEVIRMVYAIAENEFVDIRLTVEEWFADKPETPLGQLPVLTSDDGVLCQTNVITRYLAKKFGLAGSSSEEEAQNDSVVEMMHEVMNNFVDKVTKWKVLTMETEPEDSEKIVQDIKEDLLKKLAYINSCRKEGNRFTFGNEIQLADVWLYTTLEFSKQTFPDAMEITPWVKEFTDSFQSDPRVKAYLAKRPAAIV